jgi:hypothetical protein
VEFSSDQEIQKIPELVREFFEHVLCEEYEPIFVGDDATVWDVSMATPDELLRRCSEYYKTPVSLEDLKKPLVKLLPELNERRTRGSQ